MINTYWKKYLEEEKLSEMLKYTGSVCFGTEADVANKAVEKILAGEMRATIYPAMGYRRAMCGMPEIGSKNIVVDWMGNPACIIETTDVQEVAVCALTDEMCRMEGNAQNAAEWRETQMAQVKTEVEELGNVFSDETKVFVETFRKIYPAE